MTTIERIAAIVASNRVLAEESGDQPPNMLIYEIATVATAAVWTAGAAGNVTCKKAIVAIEKLLKESKK
jgi:hypothetical protein